MHLYSRIIGILSLGALPLIGAVVEEAVASGFRIPEVSIAGLGTSDALVANPDEFGALPYNPAAMVHHETLSAAPGLILINPNPSVTPIGGSGKVDSDGASSIPTPNLYVMGKVQRNWAFGLGINAPFGLETKWDDGTFPGFAGPPDLGAFEPEETKLKMLNYNPNVAYQVDSIRSSFSLGVDYYQVIDAVLNTQLIQISGDGDGWGWNAGYLYVHGPLSFGISYRSKVETDIDGTFDATAALLGESSMKTEITFPEILQIGIRYEALPDLSVEFDVERTGWDSIDAVRIAHSTSLLLNPYVETSNWNDVWTYRLGGVYQISPFLKALFGYSYDNTPQGDNFFTPRLPDSDRQSISLGVAYEKGRWTAELAYMYVRLQERRFSGNRPFLPNPFVNDPLVNDPNGTALFNGTYETYGNLFGFGLRVAI